LSVAPHPISTELLSSWLLRVAAANQLPFSEFLDAFESQYGSVLTNVPIDYAVPNDGVMELVLVAGTNKSYAEYQRLAAAVGGPQDLYRIPLIWREAGSGTRAVTETALRKAGIQLKRLTYQYVMADVEAIKTATIHCLGFSFLSRWSVKNEVAAGRLRILHIANLNVRRGFFWVLPSGALGEPGDTFVRFCQANSAQVTAS
jgi:DNA-binding transcriptional LysR family regulator